jgi:hypothetical protein
MTQRVEHENFVFKDTKGSTLYGCFIKTRIIGPLPTKRRYYQTTIYPYILQPALKRGDEGYDEVTLLQLCKDFQY